MPTREIIEKIAECRQEMENIEVKGYKAEYYYRRLEDMLRQAEREAIGVWNFISEK